MVWKKAQTWCKTSVIGVHNAKIAVADDVGWTVRDKVPMAETHSTEATHYFQLKG